MIVFSNLFRKFAPTLDLQRQTETEIEMVNLQWKNKY